MKNQRAIVFALLFAVLAIIMIWSYVSRFERQYEAKYEKMPVVHVQTDLPAGMFLDQTMFEVKMIPKPFVQPDAVLVQKLPEVLTNAPSSLAAMKQGEQLLLTKIDFNADVKVSEKIPRGSRACTVAVNQVSGVGGHVQTGDHVDVIGTFRTLSDDKAPQIKDLEAVTLFQDVPVLATGHDNRYQRIRSTADNPEGLFKTPPTSRNQGFNHVTLQTSPRDCMDLVIAQEVGSLTLALRSNRDRNTGKTIDSLKTNRSTTSSVTGIKEPVQIQTTPKWLELRGEQGVLVP
jgi:pilus assembly protein CpaB